MRPVLIAADDIWRISGKDVCVISHKEGNHGPYSVHYYGFALDLDTSDLSLEQALLSHIELKARLGRSFLCKIRQKHIHIEYKYWQHVK
jgi:hypothetical protein